MSAGRAAWLFGEPGREVEGHRYEGTRQRARAEAWSGAKSFRQRRFLHGSWFLAVSGGIGKAAGGAYRQLPEHSRQAESRHNPFGIGEGVEGLWHGWVLIVRALAIPPKTAKNRAPERGGRGSDYREVVASVAMGLGRGRGRGLLLGHRSSRQCADRCESRWPSRPSARHTGHGKDR